MDKGDRAVVAVFICLAIYTWVGYILWIAIPDSQEVIKMSMLPMMMTLLAFAAWWGATMYGVKDD